MLKKILIGLLLVVVAFLGYVASLPGEFRVSRGLWVNAPAAAVFAHVNDLHKFDVWNPWSKIDPTMKKGYEGPTAGVGAISTWDGNKDIGSGKMTITDSQPSSVIRMKLEFYKPFAGVNDVEFTFKPEGAGTVVTWAMSGKSPFIARIFCVLMRMNMDQMVGGEFEKGLAQLKTIAEK